jgi:hypothetical protein
MDITATYLRMCQKAKEIQEAWKPKDFDFIIDNTKVEYNDDILLVDNTDLQLVDIDYAEPESQEYQTEYEYYKTRTLWLPRQDQLQELIEPDKSKIYQIVDKVVTQKYYYPPKEDYISGPEIFNSMEQLWLAYVMKEKFGKIWYLNEWVLPEK